MNEATPMVDFPHDPDDFDLEKINAPWPSAEELDAAIKSGHELLAKSHPEYRHAGFVFDEVVGYTPWGHGGPATEVESWN